MPQRFSDVYQAVGFYSFGNPARARYINLFEADHGSAPASEQFSGEHPNDLWASIAAGVAKVLDNTGDSKATKIFEMYFPSSRDAGLPKEVIARELGISTRHVSRLLRRVLEDLEEELQRREILPRSEQTE